jgi:hypothetical protein
VIYYNLEESDESGMDAQVHTYARDSSQELVFRARSAQRNNELGRAHLKL